MAKDTKKPKRITQTKEEVPPRIEDKSGSKREKAKKHSWLAYEAPNKDGVKIEVYQGRAKIMREKLMEQPEISTFIPLVDGESKSVPQIVNLNGYKLNIPKNTYVSLPQQIHDVIRASHKQTQDAFTDINNRLGIDRDEKSASALS